MNVERKKVDHKLEKTIEFIHISIKPVRRKNISRHRFEEGEGWILDDVGLRPPENELRLKGLYGESI